MRISVAVPVYDMPNGDFFLKRLKDSLAIQTFRDFELVITREGKMAENTNAAIKASSGELIKILYMDDYLTHENSLQMISDAFEGEWLVTGCAHNPGTHTHLPVYNERIHEGINTIGSPSVLTLRNDDPLLFDETLTWMLDCDLYKRLYEKHGPPTILNDINVTIGIHEGQTTFILDEETKQREHDYLIEKHS